MGFEVVTRIKLTETLLEIPVMWVTQKGGRVRISQKAIDLVPPGLFNENASFYFDMNSTPPRILIRFGVAVNAFKMAKHGKGVFHASAVIKKIVAQYPAGSKQPIQIDLSWNTENNGLIGYLMDKSITTGRLEDR